MTCRASFVVRFIVFLALALLVSVPSVRASDSPTASWYARLAVLERTLAQLPATDAAGRDALSIELAGLHSDIDVWLAGFPPARDAEQPWLEAAGDTRDLAALAAETSRLRAVLSRIDQALRSGGDGAFYLGRVDVDVTATAAVSPMVELAPVGATVLGAEDLRLHNKVALSDALALAPGVSFTRIGQRNEGTVYVRGFDNRQVPIFIDGIPVYTPYDGYADLDRFTMSDVAELRVSKGFSSVLYGANALGGAINIVSRRPNGRLEGIAATGIGSGSARQASLNVGTRFDRWYAQGGASYLEADTYPMSDDFAPVKIEDGGDRNNAYRKDTKFNVKLGVTARDGDEYAISYVGQRGEKGNPPYAGTDPAVRIRYWRWPYWDKDSLYLVTNTNLGQAGYLRGRVYYDTYDNALYSYDDATFTSQARPSSFKSLYHDNTAGGSLEWGAAIGGRHTLRAAFHFKDENHQENNVGEPVQRKEGRIVSAGVEDSWTVSTRVSVVAGISGDWQATTKAETLELGKIVDQPMGDTSGVNPQVGVFVGVPAGMVRATVSRKTRLPSMKDRYSYRLGTAIPNPYLEPEVATTFETGFQGALGRRTSVQASVFYSRIDDLIQRFYVQPNVSQQRNIGEASSAGLELDARTRPADWLELSANYTFLDRDNLSDPAVPLTDTPAHKGMVAVSVTPVAAVRVSATVEYDAGRQTLNEAGKLFDVPSFALLGVKATWTVWKGLDLDVSAVNLTDRNYWTAEGYPEAGRVVLAGLRYRF